MTADEFAAAQLPQARVIKGERVRGSGSAPGPQAAARHKIFRHAHGRGHGASAWR
eukprot:CAMPEP_0168464824 /NCGR_PEP_ID=MMETSP0228-20121227/55783_1 /TAXON_ID=133427 /ORGANISM="Protoceratium reticulatum, Strain CCCM 535 (=CCMP 1889)" /LENGTH=54 /DNA_ID=CAMNT_0008480349 /DNA_START=53 /DNA_END=214 /DNA_ORIENTATION=+